MNPKNTGIWFVAAAALFALVLAFEHFLHPAAPATSALLPDLQPATVTGLQVIPSGALEIRASRLNNGWQLLKPVAYPAQTAAIEALLDALQQLKPATRITAAELHNHPNADQEYGFEQPRLSLVIESGGQRRQLLVGNLTPPGDQVFLRLVGVDGAFVADAGWLKYVPRSASDWRSTALADTGSRSVDWIVLTNGTRVIELRRDATNRLWRMVRPFPARADAEHITEALQQLLTARVTQFVADNPPDLGVYGLQPADLDVWLGHGANVISALHVGKSPTNDPAQVYARREGWNTVVTTAKDPLSPWRSPVNDFRDSHLLELTAPVAEIAVQGREPYTLRRSGSNDWQVVGQKFPADADNVQLFISTLASLRVADFVKDVVTAPDLPAYGLATPGRQITLYSTAGDTNSTLVQLDFGTNQDDEVFVRRADEDFIYAIKKEDFNRLPEYGWEFRDRRIWNFSATNVAQITLHQNGKTRQLVHNGPNKWSLAAGSQGIINPPALEETAYRLGSLTAAGWVGYPVTDPQRYGVEPGNLSVTVELRTGGKYTVDFGTPISNQTALAVVTLDGERWAFVFPPVLYQFVSAYLTIPANAP